MLALPVTVENILGDHIGYAELQAIMGSDEDIVAAARVSRLGESKGPKSDKKLLLYLVKHHHDTPLEMGEIKIRLKMPLVSWWQLVRHRSFSLNLQSGRYSIFPENVFYIPNYDAWRLQSESNRQGSKGLLAPDKGQEFTSALEAAINRGYMEYQAALAAGIAKEQARLFLHGFSVYYTGIVKGDLRAWLHFSSLRTADDAQYEIRVYAQSIYEYFLKDAFPWSCEYYEAYRKDSI